MTSFHSDYPDMSAYVRHDDWDARGEWAKPRSVRLEPGAADWKHEREWCIPLTPEWLRLVAFGH